MTEEIVVLDEITEAIVDCEHKTAPTQPQGVPCIRTTNITNGRLDLGSAKCVSEETYREWTKRIEPRADDLILAREAPVGEVAIIPEGTRVCLGQRTVLIRPNKDKVVPRYLLYLLISPEVRHELRTRAEGSTTPHLNLRDIRSFRLPVLASLDEQRAIAHILGTLDDKIELNRRMNRTLEAIARAIFKSWFVDFDPVIDNALAAGKPIPEEFAERAARRAQLTHGKSPLPENIRRLFPDEFQDSELGPIPKGWEVTDIYKVADVIYGAPFKSTFFNESGNGLPLIRIRDLSTHNPTVFTPEKHPKGYLVNPGDLVVGMDGEFRAHLWRGPQAWLNQRLCCFRPKSSIPRAFVHYSIETPLRFFEYSKAGTTVIHLGKSDIDTFRVVLSPSPILAAFGSIAEPCDSSIVFNAAESRVLVTLRDILLPNLISGELPPQNVKAIVKRAKA